MQETPVSFWVRKIPWRRYKLPLQYSGLENAMDCIVHGVTKSQAPLSHFHFHMRILCKKKCGNRSRTFGKLTNE